MSLVLHQRRVKSHPKSIHDLGLWWILFVLFLIGKGQPSYAQETTRIFSGTTARKGRYPYMCSLRKYAYDQHICGGVLIDKDWMMTAAHCVDPKNENSTGLSPFAYCNIFNIYHLDPPMMFKTSCRVHHMWDGYFGNGSDIALCELDKSTGLSIPKLASIDQSFTEDSVFNAIGWGNTSDDSGLADTLQIGENLKYISNSACNAGRKLDTTIIENMICAGDGSADTCKGDSGGPLFEASKQNNPLAEDPKLDLIVGITSFGRNTCQDAPGVYTRLSCYRAWIDCVIRRKGQVCKDHIPCEEKSNPCLGVSRSSNFNEANALKGIDGVLRSDNAERVKEILCQGLSPNAVVSDLKHSLLIRAAQHDVVKSAQVLLQQGANLEYKNTLGQTALSRAANYGSARVAQLFIDNGANIESRDDNGWTALFYAARYNRSQIAQLLIDNGAELDSETHTGWTPLHAAAYYNSHPVAKELIAAGADISAENVHQSSPLFLAARQDSIEVAKELIAAGAAINKDDGWAPLHIAAQRNSTRVAKELISAGANLSSRTNTDFTPLHVAVRYNSTEVAKELITANANLSSRTNRGFTPLHLTAQYNSVEIAKELLSNNAEVEVRTNIGDTPLHIASYHGSFDVLQMLLDEEAIVESVNNNEQTPFHYASSRGHVSIVRALLRRGASKSATDNDGKTPFDVICTDENLDEPCKEDVIITLRQLLG